MFGLLGRNPLQNGAVELGLVCFALVALGVAVVRDPAMLPLRFVAAPPVLLSIVLAILIGVRGSVDPEAARFELRRFLAEGLLFLVGGVVIGRRRRDFDLWALLLAATAAVSALLVTAGLAFDHDRWAGASTFALYAEATPRALARDTAAALVAAAYVALTARDERLRLGALTALPVLLIGFAASDERAPLLGVVAGLVVLLALTVGRARRNALLLGVVPVLAAAVPIARLVSEHGASRLLELLVGAQGSAHARLDEWSLAWHTFGVVGLLLVFAVVVWLAVTLLRARRAIERPRLALAWALAVAALLDASVAGGLATSPYLWFAAGLALGLAGDTALAPRGLIRWTRGEMLAPVPAEESLIAPPPRPSPVGLGLVLDDVEGVVGGTIVLRASAEDDAALRWVEFQVSPAGAHEWHALARVERPPFVLPVDTRRLADGLYDFRALGADRGGRVEFSRPARARRVANATREIVVHEPRPGSWVRGVVHVAARVSDGAPVVFELSRDGETWEPLPEDSWDTTLGLDGEYLLRAVALDGLGASGAVGIAVDNTPPAVRVGAMDMPGSPAAVRIAVEAEDAGSGVLAVRFQGSYDGAVWDELTSLSEPPYEIDLETEELTAPYHVRCVVRDRAGNDAATDPIAVPARVAVPAPAPEPESALEPALLSLERATLWDLERLVAARPADPEREEQEALLYSLRPYANVDGTIPTQFWDLVRKTFGDLVA